MVARPGEPICKNGRWPNPVRDSCGQHDRRFSVISRKRAVARPVHYGPLWHDPPTVRWGKWIMLKRMVRAVGIEPTLLAERDFESRASTNSTTPATRSLLAKGSPLINCISCAAFARIGAIAVLPSGSGQYHHNQQRAAAHDKCAAKHKIEITIGCNWQIGHR